MDTLIFLLLYFIPLITITVGAYFDWRKYGKGNTVGDLIKEQGFFLGGALIPLGNLVMFIAFVLFYINRLLGSWKFLVNLKNKIKNIKIK